jgi:microcystin-dependent protein
MFDLSTNRRKIMSDQFVGEIRMFGGNFEPLDWAFCDGRTLPISTYDTLYSVIGTTYGGDGVTNFKLPDLRGRVPVHKGQGTGLTNRLTGSSFGAEGVTLGATNIPAHSHVINVGGDATTAAPANNYPGNSVGFNLYSSAATSDSTMNPAVVETTGGAISPLPHSNLMPTLCMNFIIALYGIFPTQS